MACNDSLGDTQGAMGKSKKSKKKKTGGDQSAAGGRGVVVTATHDGEATDHFAGLPDTFVRFMQRQRLSRPSPIQAQFWPVALSGADVIVRLAFSLFITTAAHTQHEKHVYGTRVAGCFLDGQRQDSVLPAALHPPHHGHAGGARRVAAPCRLGCGADQGTCPAGR